MRRRELMLLLGGMMTAARAQQAAMRVVGYLTGGSLSGRSAPALAAFLQGLGETGYIEGRNVAIEYRMGEGSSDRLPAFAADLVRRKVDVIFADGSPVILAAKNATSTIPIVFNSAADPVAAGLVTSFARPGGNLTGASFINAELLPKRLELLSELVPRASVFALLVNPNWPNAEPMIPNMQEAARTKGLLLHILRAGSESEIDATFATLVQLHVEAVVISPNQLFFIRQDQLVALAARYAVPASYESREFVAVGGLISYGPNFSTIYRLLGTYAGKILNGAKPADLPVQQPTTFELVVNLTTAKALGLTIPPSILARADEVIE
jgi:putative tryptophan/tyrosine transport system substrate-binding protein